MLPKGWQVVELAEIIRELESGVSVNGEDRPAWNGEIGVLKVSAISEGFFYAGENKAVLPSERSRVRLSPRRGDILVSRSNTLNLIGASGYVEADYPTLFLPDKLWRVVLRDSARDSSPWLKHMLNWPCLRSQLRARASGTSASMKNISKQSFLTIQIARPSFGTQSTIADILDRWDSTIRTLEALLSAKQQFKRGLMQQLLAGKRRFKEFAGQKWKLRRFGEFLSESRIPGGNGNTARKLSVRLYGRGISEKRETKVGSAATRYYRRRAGQLIYSKLDFLNGAFAVIPPALDDLESTLDLPAFDADSTVDVRWLLYFLVRPEFYTRQVGLAHGGRKARRVGPDDFLGIQACVPSKPEQVRIADVLGALDREIRLLGSQFEALRRQKKGLMQKLLTGQIRVKC